MIGVDEALKIIGQNLLPIEEKMVPLESTIGGILQEDIIADRDFPPFDRVTMDGIAIRFQDYQSGLRQFPIEATVSAGQAPYSVQNPHSCVEIMTGAMLPEALDTVIRYEDVVIENGTASLSMEGLKANANVHKKGSDRKAGESIVRAPRQLSPAEIAIAATVGKSKVRVAALPTVLVVSTGDELIAVDETPLPQQIRSSNIYTVSAALHRRGIPVEHAHLRDDANEVFKAISSFLTNYQTIIFLGGSSKGKFDYIPDTLRKLGVKELFYKLRQRPGKPFMFGVHPAGQFVFALPGNPVSAYMCLTYYFQHWLNLSLGLSVDLPVARLSKSVTFKPPLTYFLQVKIENVEGQIVAHPVEGRGSGDLANLVDADAFLILPEGRDLYPRGESYKFIIYR